KNKRSVGSFNFFYSLIFISTRFNNILDTKFISDSVGPDGIPFIIGFKNLRKAKVFIPGLQGNVNAFLVFGIFIPLRIIMGLPQQCNASHHRRWIALPGSSSVE